MKLPRVRRTSLNQLGFDHVMLGVASFVLVGLVGTALLVQSHAYTLVSKGELAEGSASSGYCLSASGPTNGSKAVLNACANASFKTWSRNNIRKATVMGVSNVQEFTLQSTGGTTECLNNPHGSKTNGTQLQLYTCSSSDPNGLWVWGGSLTNKGLSARQLVNVATITGSKGLCLDDAYGAHTANTKVQLWACKTANQTNQSWFEVAGSSGSGGTGTGSGGSGSTGSTGTCGTSTGAHPTTYTHVIWIWMENHPYNEIIGSSQAPYINSLAKSCALSQQAAYDSPFSPSAPNYIAATSGRNESASNAPGAGDCAPTSCPASDVSIFEQVSSWKTYSEGEPTNCDPGFDGDAYDVNHNPAVYYTRITAACKKYAVPLGTLTSGALVSDLGNNTLPQFSLIDPNLNDDMHDGTIAQGDTYLSQLIPLITSSQAYKSGNTVIFLTWDEDEGGVGIPMVVVSPYVKPGLVFGGKFTHFSLLRTTEEMLGITTFLQNASSAPSMRSSLGL